MATSNFLKTMKNVDLSSSGNRTQRNNKKQKNNNFSIKVDLNDVDKKRLSILFSEELKYYNALINSLSSMCRAFPEKLLKIDKRKEKLFLELAGSNFKISKIYNKTDVELPNNLKQFEDILLGKDVNNNRILNEEMQLFFDIACSSGKILPEVRKNMAYEILAFYKEQARLRVESKNMKLPDDTEFKGNPSELEVVDNSRKRHIQVPKSSCKIEWDAEEQISYLYLPYLTTKLTFPNVNLKKEYWSVVIVHQEPGVLPRTDTPWFIDIKTNPVRYFIKYLELNNPYAGSSFFSAKMR